MPVCADGRPAWIRQTSYSPQAGGVSFDAAAAEHTTSLLSLARFAFASERYDTPLTFAGAPVPKLHAEHGLWWLKWLSFECTEHEGSPSQY